MMTKIITILMVFFIVSLANADTRILFVVEQGRAEATLKNDAELIASVVGKSKQGDQIEGMTLSGEEIFSFQGTEKNKLKLRKEQGNALAKAREWFIREIRSSEKQKKVDVATAIKRGFERFNSGATKSRYILVMMTSGLHAVGSVAFTEGRYPSDSWLDNPASPFKGITPNMTGKNVDVIFVTENDDFLNQLHSQKIERFYALLLNAKKARLVGFSDDHKVSSDLIMQGVKVQKPVPKPEPSDGKLSIYKIDSQETSLLQKKHNTPSVKVKAVPEKLSGTVLQIAVDNGIASLWVSLRDPKGIPINQTINPQEIYLQETINGSRKRIPVSSVKVDKKSKKPLAVVLLRDVSISLSGEGVRQSGLGIGAFINRIMDGDIVAIVNFNHNITLIRNFTEDKGALLSSLGMPSASGGTAFYDAVVYGLALLKKYKSHLKAVIAFTDGVDSGSKLSEEVSLKAVSKAGIPLFLIGVGQFQQDYLRKFALSSGGMFSPISDMASLSKVYDYLSGIVNNSVIVSYPTTAKTGDNVRVDALVEFQRSDKRFEGTFSSDVFIQ